MELLIVIAFVIGYALIAFEHSLRIDKAASALLTGVFCWLILTFGMQSMPAFSAVATNSALPDGFIEHSLFEHLGHISEILFFLLGAMMIVELVDLHDGFRIITDRIATRDRVQLLWLISGVTFFLSSVLDNIPIMFAVLTMDPQMSHGQWLLVTLTAGVGGSLLSIGSAAGVALMGLAQGNYTFSHHLRWTWAIALGYAASIAAHLVINAAKF